jgi:hypothetical protein
MSEKSLQTLVSYIDEPPEMDADQEDLENRLERGLFESSKIEILDAIGTDEFKETWLVLKSDIQNETLKLQRIFSEQTLDKIFEIYDFTFPENIDLNTEYRIKEFYEFLEFLEYNNVTFLTHVWQHLDVSDLTKLDIQNYCKRNSDKIINEVEEQLDIHPQNRIISLFLRTYYKEKFIEWFVINSEKSRIEITITLLQEKEKKNE